MCVIGDAIVSRHVSILLVIFIVIMGLWAAPAGAYASDALSSVYQAHQEQFTSTGYLFRVFGILAALLVGFYGVARWILPKWLEQTQGIPASSANKQKFQSFLRKTPDLAHLDSLKPRILARTPLGPGREVHVVQVQNRLLVVGSTAQQVTLLTELENASATEPAETPQASLDSVYQKYLTHPGLDV